jgi:hypothetical protein
MKPETTIQKDALPELRVEFKKRANGSVVLRCIRRDGSTTWQCHEKHAAFFSFHDLRHFAVETTLGLKTGFYGLIADGWDIEDTTGKGTRGRVPPTSLLAEHVVGLLESERAGGSPPLCAAEFNAQIDAMLGVDENRMRFTDAQLADARNRTEELYKEWADLPAGSTLKLTFNRD